LARRSTGALVDSRRLGQQQPVVDPQVRVEGGQDGGDDAASVAGHLPAGEAAEDDGGSTQHAGPRRWTSGVDPPGSSNEAKAR
jgi:hypothetical protein